MARYYIDCEFDGHNGPLLSLAMVAQYGLSLHVTTNERARDNWVQDNVIPIMQEHDADMFADDIPVSHVGSYIRRFFGDDPSPVVVADSPVDIGRFCQAISTAESGGWASADYSHMTFEVYNVDCYPTALEGAVQHNAWWDAMALREKLMEKSA